MKYLKIKISILFLFMISKSLAQDLPIISINNPSHNSMLYNRFLLNPAFSFVRESDRNISLLSRNQWVTFDDSPKSYSLNYSGKLTDRKGFGLSVFKRTEGIMTSFGGVGNFALQVPFAEDFGMTFGANASLYVIGVDKSRIITDVPDPAIMVLEDASILSFHPGINLNYKDFDFGLYAENLVKYNFISDGYLNYLSDVTYYAHAMHTLAFENLEEVFEKGTLQSLVRLRHNPNYNMNYNLSAVVNFPKLGWMQGGYDSYYGMSAGIGFHLLYDLSVGYVYERMIKDQLSNLGATHEFNLTFNPFAKNHKDWSSERDYEPRKKTEKENFEETEDQSEKQAEKTKQAKLDKQAEKERQAEEAKQAKIQAQAEKDRLAKEAQQSAKKEAPKNTLAENQAQRANMLREKAYQNKLKKENTFREMLSKQLVTREKLVEDKVKRAKLNKEKDPEINLTAYVLPEIIDETLPLADKNRIIDKNIAKLQSDIKKLQAEIDVLARQEAEAKQREEAQALKGMNEEQIKELYSKKTTLKRQASTKNDKIETKDVVPGFYLVANVFNSESNALAFMNELINKKKLDAQMFVNPVNGFKYVYLKHCETREEALAAYYSNLSDTYFGEMWILSVVKAK